MKKAKYKFDLSGRKMAKSVLILDDIYPSGVFYRYRSLDLSKGSYFQCKNTGRIGQVESVTNYSIYDDEYNYTIGEERYRGNLSTQYYRPLTPLEVLIISSEGKE